MTQAERRELILFHARLIALYIASPPGYPTSKGQLIANRDSIVTSAVRLHELAIPLEP